MIVKFGANVGQVGGPRPAEQVPGEDARPGGLGVDPQAAPVLGRRADEAVLGVDDLVREVVDQPRAEAVVVRLADRPVDRAPPDLVATRRLVDEELVLGTAAGVLAGPDDERALGRHDPLACPDRVLVQLGGRQVRADGPAQGGRARWGLRAACGHSLVAPWSAPGRVDPAPESWAIGSTGRACLGSGPETRREGVGFRSPGDDTPVRRVAARLQKHCDRPTGRRGRSDLVVGTLASAAVRPNTDGKDVVRTRTTSAGRGLLGTEPFAHAQTPLVALPQFDPCRSPCRSAVPDAGRVRQWSPSSAPDRPTRHDPAHPWRGRSDRAHPSRMPCAGATADRGAGVDPHRMIVAAIPPTVSPTREVHHRTCQARNARPSIGNRPHPSRRSPA